jgi:hypothetical protein
MARTARIDRLGSMGFLVLVLLWQTNVSSAQPALKTALVSNPIVSENRKAGSTGWQMGGPGYQLADDASGQIKGYASATSVLPGQQINLLVTVDPPQAWTMNIYRIGWYKGLGGRLVRTVTRRSGITQPPCPADRSTGLVECDWSVSYKLVVPTTWMTGVYVALLTNAQNYQNYIVFVVRSNQPADILFQLPVNTYQAYNDYPEHTFGKSLYDPGSSGPPTVAGDRAVEVSFDRPYTWDGAGDLFKFDAYFIWWMESRGYDVAYSTDIDTHERPDSLSRYRAFVSEGHDEYWSKGMFDAAERARDAGVNLAFFGGNDIYWQVRYAPSSRGVRDRVLVCYKDASLDPIQGPTTTVQWRDPPVNRPEQTLLGVQTQYTPGSTNDPYVVKDASSWVFGSTGMRSGDSVPGMVGYEYDHYQSGIPLPPASVDYVSESPIPEAQERMGIFDVANSALYRAASGAWVFAAGTVQWAWGLSKPGVADWRIGQITRNILDRYVK